MRVIHVYPIPFESYYPKYNGADLPPDSFDEEVVRHTDLELRYLTRFHQRGDRCTLIYPRCFGHPEKSFTHAYGYEIRRFPITLFESSRHRMRGPLALGMLRYLREEKPDVIQVSHIYAGGYFPWTMLDLVARLGKRLRIPVVGWYGSGHLSTAAGGRFPWVRRFYRRLRIRSLRHLAGIASVNQDELDRLFDPASPHYYGGDFSSIPHCLAPNTFDPDRFGPGDRLGAQRELGLNPACRYILMVSRLCPEKGLHVLIDAFVQIRTRVPEARLLVVGDFIAEEPEYRQQMLLRMEQPDLKPFVRFCGRVEPNQGLPLYFQAACAFALPTRRDTFAAVNIEAMACGLPVVSCSIGEIPRYLRPGLGTLVPWEDPNALAAALLPMVQGAFVRDEALAQQVLARYDYRQAGDRLREWLLERIADGRGKAAVPMSA